MRVAIPHDLPREEVRKRLSERSHQIADHIPGGMAQVTTDWANEDRMNLNISAMGHHLGGKIDIENGQMVLEIALPDALGFVEPMISSAIRQQGHKLLAPPEAD